MHADFDADGGALGWGEAEEAGDGVAEGEACEVVQYDGECYDVAAGDDVGGVVGYDDCYDGGYGEGGEHGEKGGDSMAEGTEVVVGDDAEEDGEDDDLGDAGEHGGDVDLDGLASEEQDKGGGEDGGEECGEGCHGYAEGYVAFGEVADDVAGGASGAAAYEDDAEGELGREVEDVAEDPCGAGHDDELCQLAGEDVVGVCEDGLEVGGAEGESHAEHDDAEQGGDCAGGGPEEGVWADEGDGGDGEDEECHVVGDVAGDVADVFHRVLVWLVCMGHGVC